MKYTIPFIFAILSIVNISCRKEASEKVDQDEIWVDYRLIYHGDLDSTYSRVSFRHNEKYGQSLKLSSKAMLTVDGNTPYFNIGFMWYQFAVHGFDSLANFNYKDLDQNEYMNTIRILNTIELPDIDTLHKDSLVYLPWVGNPIQDNEIVWLVIDGGLDDKIPHVSIDSLGKNGLYVVPDSLTGLPLGDVSIHFERWYQNPVNGNSVGATGYGHYISKKKQVKLVSN